MPEPHERNPLRCRLWVLMVAPLFLGIAAFLVRELAPITRVHGQTNVSLRIKVVDSASQTPVADAEVRIVDPDPLVKNGTVVARTDDQGIFVLVLPLAFAGERTRFRENVAVDYRYRWLEASAPGFVRWRTPLSRATGMERDLAKPAPVITLALTKAVLPKTELGDLAGVYEDNRRWLEILPDGRFFATLSHEHGAYEKTYGLARVEGPYLLMNAFDRPTNARDLHWAAKIVAERYHRVPWGERLYLIAVGEELKFCNSINLRGVDRISTLDNNYYMREGDRYRPLHGFPKLPAPWDSYLLREPLTGRVTKVFLDGSGQIDLGAKDGLLVGMELCLDEKGYCALNVTKVDRASSLVEYAEPWFCSTGLAKGSVVTTRFKPPTESQP